MHHSPAINLSAACRRRERLPFLLLAVLLFLASWMFAGCQPADRPPNILLIMVDDLGPEWISAYGSESIETPNLDRLAAEGLLFTNAYSMPQCTPSRITLLTGQYPFRHGWTNHWDVPRWGAGAHFDPLHNYSFARLFRSHGYATAAAGKWQVNDFRVQPSAMSLHGFDEYAMWTGYETLNPPSAERYYDPYIHTRDGSRTYHGLFGPDFFTDFLVDFMTRHVDQPMLIYYPMVLTHPPLVPTPHAPDAEGIQDRHKAMTRYMDFLVGKLIDTLDALQLRENTYVFFTTDNGTSRGITGQIDGQRVEGGKGTLGENGMHAPLIVSAPGRMPRGIVSDALVDFTDFFPTFADLAGLPLPQDLIVDGHSFAQILKGENTRGNRNWVLSMGFGPARLTDEGVQPVKNFTDRAVRNDRYKIWVENAEITALYDLERDPYEKDNLIGANYPDAEKALDSLSAVLSTFPLRDSAPRYEALPPQPWDIHPEQLPR